MQRIDVVQNRSQFLSSLCNPRRKRGERNVKHECCIGIRKVLNSDQRQRGAALWGNLQQGREHLGRSDLVVLSRRSGDYVNRLWHQRLGMGTLGATQMID